MNQKTQEWTIWNIRAAISISCHSTLFNFRNWAKSDLETSGLKKSQTLKRKDPANLQHLYNNFPRFSQKRPTDRASFMGLWSSSLLKRALSLAQCSDVTIQKFLKILSLNLCFASEVWCNKGPCMWADWICTICVPFYSCYSICVVL